MEGLTKILAGRFIIANLGSGGDEDYDLPRRFRRVLTVIEADAADSSRATKAYYARHVTNGVIAGSAGRGQFRRNKHVGCSSLLQPREDLIRLYGVERYFEVESISEVICQPISDLLAELGLNGLDFLKTDLEGVDFAVIQSLGSLLDQVLAIQCEIRFQPFFTGEPYFHEVAAYLDARGFDLISLTPEYWKPKTTHSHRHKDGRLLQGDCVFMRRMESLTHLPLENRRLAHAKQVIIASMLGRRCYGEYLLEQSYQLLPPGWFAELQPLVMPQPVSMRRVLRKTAVWKFLRSCRRRILQRNHLGFDFSHVAES